VLLQIGLAPHTWKNLYMALYPGHFREKKQIGPGPTHDVWDLLSQTAEHRYSESEYGKYLPLFDGGIVEVLSHLNDLIGMHGEVVPISLKLAVLRGTSQLEAERSLYLHLPVLLKELGDADQTFAARFKETVRRLALLARTADNIRRSLEPGT